jgi:flagellar basal body-associated protein FliL
MKYRFKDIKIAGAVLFVFVCLIIGSLSFPCNSFAMSQDREQKVEDSLNEIFSSKEFEEANKEKTVLEKLSDVIEDIIDKIKEALGRVDFPEENDVSVKPKVNTSGQGPIFRIIVFILVVLLVAAIIYLIVKYRKNRKHKEEEDSELLSQLKDFDEVKRQAMEFYKNGDFRQGIRFLYLSLILKLNEQNLLLINKAKTNKEYMNELREKDYIHFETVLEFTRVFNRFWYGNRNLNKEMFDKWISEYSSIVGEVNS